MILKQFLSLKPILGNSGFIGIDDDLMIYNFILPRFISSVVIMLLKLIINIDAKEGFEDQLTMKRLNNFLF